MTGAMRDNVHRLFSLEYGHAKALNGSASDKKARMAKKRSIPKIEQLQAEAEHLFQAVNAEPPLACALIVGASVEKAVLGLVGKYFVDGETAKEMLSENGILGTFASCAKMAYCLGLVSKGMFENINRIGFVRNIFAHSNIYVDFNERSIVELCSNLTFPKRGQLLVVGGGTPTPWSELTPTPRDRFSLIGTMTFNRLLLTMLSTGHKEKLVDSWDSPDRD